MDLSLWCGNGINHSSQRPASRKIAQSRGQRTFAFEQLEDRTVLSSDPLGGLVSGPAAVDEGNTYQLELNGGDNVLAYTIDWGDGTDIEVVAGTEASAAHVYDDGIAEYSITVTANVAFDGEVFHWSTDDGGNGHYYLLTSQESNWLDAEAEAAALGGHLASITSQEEQDFIVETFLSGADGNNIYWIGLNDADNEGTFVWSSGEAVTYTNWNPGEPNNFGTGEDYVAINWHLVTGRADGVLGDWNDSRLEGVNASLSADEPWYGIIELGGLPSGDEVVTTFQATVSNVAPTASLAGPTTGVRGQQLTFTLDAADPSHADEAAGFAYNLDWNGDGVVDETVQGTGPLDLQHTFAQAGTYVFHVTAMDKDGGVSDVVSHVVEVTAFGMQVDPHDPARTVLVVGGTDGHDFISIMSFGWHRTGVWINGQFAGLFAQTDVVEVFGQGGNDFIAAGLHDSEALVHGGDGHDFLISFSWNGASAWLHGGAGNDVLFGGRGNDLLDGGDGHDWLMGQGGRDVLIGGSGSDWLFGDSGDDLIISGETSFDDDHGALSAIVAEWTSDRDHETRVRNLMDGSGSSDRLNGAVYLNESTVIDDNVSDLTFGGRRDDWILRGSGDFVWCWLW